MSQFKFQAWPTEFRVITQHFGANPQNYAQFGLPGHEGVDIRARDGSKIFCVAPGQVAEVYTRASGHNYGIHVRVDHVDGYQTTYAHLQELRVKKGDQVNAGDLLGIADNTGNSFGAHLHLTLKKQGASFGNWPRNIVDPTPFLLPLLGWTRPAGPYVGGWVLRAAIISSGGLAQANPGGVTLRIGPTKSVLIPEGTILILTGAASQDYAAVQVPKAAVGLEEPNLPTVPAGQPPPSVNTVDGYAWEEFLHLFENQALVKTVHGINLRQEPDEKSQNLGVVRAGSTVTLLGDTEGNYRPVRVRRADFIGPVYLPDQPLAAPDTLVDLPDDVYLGWVRGQFMRKENGFATTRHRGVYMRDKPNDSGRFVGLIKGDATVTVAGSQSGPYIPVLVHEDLMWNVVHPRIGVSLPPPLTGNLPPVLPPPVPVNTTVAGWALANDVQVRGDEGTAGAFGLNLREAPQRDAGITGFVPAKTDLLVTGKVFGEFLPVRVDKKRVRASGAVTNPDPATYGQAKIGLHASADPTISEAEHQTFAALRPGIIKVLSFHSTEDIRRLARDHSGAAWIVRAFLDFGNRAVSPQKFVDDTLSDVQRALGALAGKEVVVELHNEPNVNTEGFGTSWRDAAAFADWWLEVLEKYREALPDQRFIYPGLSPGSSVTGVKADHIQFLEASRSAVEMADGLGLHLYWSAVYPMERSLDVLDDVIARFRNTPLWITEASNNKGGATPAVKAHQYLAFWQALQERPIVQGVTFFVASASNPVYAEEVWVGQGIAQIVGAR